MAEHRHKWFLESVNLMAGPTREVPIPGATVTWRCRGAGGCKGSIDREYKFRRPTPTAKKTSGRPLLSYVFEDNSTLRPQPLWGVV